MSPQNLLPQFATLLAKGRKKNCHKNIKEEGRTCLEELKPKKEQLRRWKKRPLTTKRKFKQKPKTTN